MSQSMVCSHCGRASQARGGVILYDEPGGLFGDHNEQECGSTPCCGCGDDRFLREDIGPTTALWNMGPA